MSSWNFYVDVEFTRPSSGFKPFSAGVRLIQGTPYSHVRLKWSNPYMEKRGLPPLEVVYEASGSAVKVIGEYGQPDVKVLKTYRIQVNKEQYGKLIQLFRFANVDYGKLQILGILLVKIFGLKKNPLTKGRLSQVCSELVAVFFKEVLEWDFDVNLDIAGPKEIDRYLQKIINSGKFTYVKILKDVS